MIPANAQNVNIPDANFKAALLAISDLNTDTDKLNISIAEASAFKGDLEINSNEIKALTGIEAFVNIKKLHCASNQLTHLDISKNTELTFLYCSHNLLTSLDISKNVLLEPVGCNYLEK